MKRFEEAQNQILESRTENLELVEEINRLFGEMYYQFCHPRVMGHADIQSLFNFYLFGVVIIVIIGITVASSV